MRIGLVALSSLLPRMAFAQNANEQLWVDLLLAKNLSQWNVKAEVSARTLLSGDVPQWSSLRLTPTVERSLTPHWDLSLGIPVVYTRQTEVASTREIRLQPGTRFNFTPYKRVQTALNLRYEQRYFHTVEPEPSTSQSGRMRIRAEVVVPIDKRNYHADTMWYALSDCEAFIVADRDVEERFANRLRTRIGIGRKFSYSWRLEFIYCLQISRRTISDDEFTRDNIFRFRLKYHFRRRDQQREKMSIDP